MADINQEAERQITEIRQICERIKPLVAIECTAYNHEPYIRDALEGFVMQKTDFPFVAIVHDDASTDKTAEIIKEYAEKYPDIILPIFENENQYSKRSLGGIVRSALKSTGAKYIAMCEGDDYWIDPLKLQKQVDFLETHPDYGLVHTNFRVLQESTKKVIHNGSKNYDIVNGNVFNQLFKECFIKTLTVVYRTELTEYTIPPNQKIFTGDRYLFFELARHTKFHYINEETSAYRLLDHSASHIPNPKNRLAFYKSLEALDRHFLAVGNVGEDIINYVKKKWLIQYMKHFLITKEYLQFKDLKNNGYLTIKKDGFYLLIYLLGRFKLGFSFLSKIWRIKNSSRNIYN